MFKVPFSPGCILFRAVLRSTTSAHRRPFTPPVKSRHFKHGPEAAGQFAASVRLRCKRRGHLLFRRAEPAERFSPFSRPAPCGLAQAGPLWGRCAPRFSTMFTPRASAAPTSWHGGMLCALFTSPTTGHFSHRSPAFGGGFGAKNVLVKNLLAPPPLFCHAPTRGDVPQEHIRRTDTHNK